MLVGHDAANLHAEDPYLVKRPIHGGAFALRPYVAPRSTMDGEDSAMTDQEEDDEIEREKLFALDRFYSLRQCLEDLEELIV